MLHDSTTNELMFCLRALTRRLNGFPPVIKDLLPEASPHCSSNVTGATPSFRKSSVRATKINAHYPMGFAARPIISYWGR
jgi:hypothetical protein